LKQIIFAAITASRSTPVPVAFRFVTFSTR
jgi:hypothetical protein